MTLLEQWRGSAYNENMTQEQYNQFWNHYFVIEKGFYESLLADNEVVTGTIPQLAEKYGIDKMVMVGILDGINDSLKQPNPIETMDETTEIPKLRSRSILKSCTTTWLVQRLNGFIPFLSGMHFLLQSAARSFTKSRSLLPPS